MDPDSNLKEQRQIAEWMLGDFPVSLNREQMADRLAELVLALDEWIRKGGFMPAAWRKP